MSPFVLGLFIGGVVGVVVGAFAVGLCVAAWRADRSVEVAP
jgi:hypothetical protein